MPFILKNKNLALHFDLPTEGYKFSRFDWTGKLKTVKFKEQEITTHENLESKNSARMGRGFYNEFGIDNALGFEETPIGGWFHKIGVGLLKKEDPYYSFDKSFKIKPAIFTVSKESDSLVINCQGELTNGYSYLLRKEISLLENGFALSYHLHNTGEKDIVTDEYVHNFISLNQKEVDESYQLSFPFAPQPGLAGEVLNPQEIVSFNQKAVRFKGTPQEPFFFSQLNNLQAAKAQWELANHKTKIGIRETGNFLTSKVNLWGCGHVISPELFIAISLKPNQQKEWTRIYQIFELGQ